MERENRSDLLEDSRFEEIKRLKKKQLPHQLYWYLKQDYFSEELLGIYNFEIENYKRICTDAFLLFEKATEKILKDGNLCQLDIPSYFHECIHYSWENRQKHPFLYGRFDVNGGLKTTGAKIIEFNADTCSTLPETILWQDIQHKELKNGSAQFNDLSLDIGRTLKKLKTQIGHPDPFILGSSFGYEEDILNVNCVLDIAYEEGYKAFYTNLEEVIFSTDEGIFYEVNGAYQPVDLWLKMIPWDWIYTEEPQLAKDLATIITEELCVVLNPAYTTIWQNKKFLAYITEHFPNSVLAETFLQRPLLVDYVSKPCFGRLGENIEVNGSAKTSSKGDFGQQDVVFQKYHALPKDLEGYHYQVGLFYTDRASALNLRTQNQAIITDDCEFMSHYSM